MPELAVVVPVYNEAANIQPLVDEIGAALDGHCDYEIIYVDDASRDGTPAALASAQAGQPRLRVLRHRQQAGQSTAVRHGIKAARSPWIATLDGDGQNDPADIPKLLDLRDADSAGTRLFAGWRVDRKDTLSKRLGSRLANGLRRRLLHDGTPDTGCGIKLIEREAFLDLPWFDHMHRYLPALMQRAGHGVRSVPVSHRPRSAGRSKYTNFHRALVGIADLWGVAWLMRRARPTTVDEMTGATTADDTENNP